MRSRDDVVAILIGEKAQELLGSPAFWGRVNAVVSNAAYLQGMGGELLWIAPYGQPAHRRCLMAPVPLRNISKGAVFRVQGQKLLLGDSIAVDVAHADVWIPERLRPDVALPLPVLEANLVPLLESLMQMPCTDGLGQAIPLLRDLIPGQLHSGGNGTSAHDTAHTIVAMHSRSHGFNPLIPDRALASAAAVAHACLHHNADALIRAAEPLIGLGPGLTPSGDDFLGGALFALSQLERAYPGLFKWRRAPADDLVPKARAQTNWISHTLMSDMAEGHAAEPLHRFVTRLLKDPEPSGAMEEVPRLLKIGHTSGWDMLAGALTGMLSVADPGSRT